MSPQMPPKGSIAKQAKVVSAFMAAFGKKLMQGKSHHAAVVAQLHEIPEGTSRLWAKNAKLIMEDGLTLLLDEVQAEIVSLDPATPMIPEKRESYTFNIQVGRMAMDEGSISTLMNRYAFPPGVRSPIYNMRVSLPDGLVVLEGTMRVNPLMTLPIHMECAVGVTASGMLEMTPIVIRSGALPVGKIMGMLGMQLDKVMPAQQESGMTFAGDRILVNPTGLLPAPKATGRLVHAEVVGEHLVMTYDNGAPRLAPLLLEPEAKSYIAMLGHDLLVGKVTMHDVNLQMVPLDPLAGWVEFALPLYRSQLAQGESSLKFGDELLYKIPAVSALRADPPRAPRSALPSPPLPPGDGDASSASS